MKKLKLLILYSLAFLLYSCDKDSDGFFDDLENKKNGRVLVCESLTFETRDAGTYINEIHTESGYGPIAVYNQARNSNGDLEDDNRAMLFDSENWTGDDDDLQADWGNVLIIQELDEEGEPNDNRWGGEMTLTFPEPVTMKSFRVLDIDNQQDDNENNSWVYLYDGSGKELYRKQLVPMGDNSKQTVDLGNTGGVVTIKIVLAGEGIVGSAAIDNLEFCTVTENGEEEDLSGCTRLRSYWLEHADPASEVYNNAWDELRDRSFFESGATFLQVLQRTPMKGEPYYMAAQPYITALLNIQSGASTTTEVEEAIAGITTYLNGEAEPTVAQLLVWAEILESYNEGEIGPGQCRE